jgi:murein endopeptidase
MIVHKVLECTISVAKEDGHMSPGAGGRTAVKHGDINVSVTIKVCRDHAAGFHSANQVTCRAAVCKCSITMIQEHGHHVGVALWSNQVRLAVMIQVNDKHVRRLIRRVIDGSLERLCKTE